MGLKYNKGETTNAASILASHIKKIVQNCENVQAIATEYSSNSFLQGEAWYVNKNRIVEANEYINYGIDMINASIEGDLQYLNNYLNTVNDESLYEDEINAQIDLIQRNINELENQIMICRMTTVRIQSGLCGTERIDSLFNTSMLTVLIDRIEEEIQNMYRMMEELIIKLESLYGLEDSTANLFSSADDLLSSVMSGINYLETFVETGCFPMDEGWKKDIYVKSLDVKLPLDSKLLRMSDVGKYVLKDVELGDGKNLYEYDQKTGEPIGLYPYYVWDHGVSFGYGIHVSYDDYMSESVSSREKTIIVDRYFDMEWIEKTLLGVYMVFLNIIPMTIIIIKQNQLRMLILWTKWRIDWPDVSSSCTDGKRHCFGDTIP